MFSHLSLSLSRGHGPYAQLPGSFEALISTLIPWVLLYSGCLRLSKGRYKASYVGQ